MRTFRLRSTTVLVYGLLVAQVAIVVFPFLILVLSSLKSQSEVYSNPLALPQSIDFGNFREVLGQGDFIRYTINSVAIGAVTILLILVTSSMGAFGLSLFPRRQGTALRLFFLAGLMVPMRLATGPLYGLMVDLGLIDTPIALILAFTALGMPFAIFLLSGFLGTIPTELFESARIDGASNLRIYRDIALPLLRPPLATVVIWEIIWVWNDFFFPFLFIASDKYMTLPLGIASFFGQYSTKVNLVSAAMIIAMLPLLVAYLFLSRQFIQGLTAGAVKL